MAEKEKKQSTIRAAASTVTGSITGGVSGGVTGGTLLGIAGAAVAAGGLALIGVLPTLLGLVGIETAGTTFGSIAGAATGANIGIAALVGGGLGAATGVTGGTFLGSLGGAGAGFRNSIPSEGPSKEELVYMERAQSTAQGMLQGATLAKLEDMQLQQAALAERQQRHEQHHAKQQEPGFWVKNHTNGPKPENVLFVEQLAQQQQQPQPAVPVPGK